MSSVSAPEAERGLSRKEKLAALVARVGSYVERFHGEMASVVLEERYVQVLRQPCCREPRSPEDEPELAWEPVPGRKSRSQILGVRRLASDLMLVQIVDGRRVSYRDVFEVDGRTVHDRDERVRELFVVDSSERKRRLAHIAEESARFNLGQFRRTTNLPTSPLLYLAPGFEKRLHFARSGEERLDDRELTVLDFREDVSPTLVATAAGIDMPAKGQLWVEPETGKIWRAELRLGEAMDGRRIMRVTFRADDRLGVLVPERMWEWYERVEARDPATGERVSSWPADLEGLAIYSNLRLFTVTTADEVTAPAP